WHNNARLGSGHTGVPPNISVGQRIKAQERPVVAAKPVVPIISHAALLCQTGHRFELAGVGVQAKLLVADVDLLAANGATDHTAEQPVCSINPVVESEAEAVDPGLVIIRVESTEQSLDDVGPTVAIGVFGVENIRRGTNQRALAPRGHACGEWEVVEKD